MCFICVLHGVCLQTDSVDPSSSTLPEVLSPSSEATSLDAAAPVTPRVGGRGKRGGKLRRGRGQCLQQVCLWRGVRGGAGVGVGSLAEPATSTPGSSRSSPSPLSLPGSRSHSPAGGSRSHSPAGVHAKRGKVGGARGRSAPAKSTSSGDNELHDSSRDTVTALSRGKRGLGRGRGHLGRGRGRLGRGRGHLGRGRGIRHGVRQPVSFPLAYEDWGTSRPSRKPSTVTTLEVTSTSAASTPTREEAKGVTPTSSNPDSATTADKPAKPEQTTKKKSQEPPLVSSDAPPPAEPTHRKVGSTRGKRGRGAARFRGNTRKAVLPLPGRSSRHLVGQLKNRKGIAGCTLFGQWCYSCMRGLGVEGRSS